MAVSSFETYLEEYFRQTRIKLKQEVADALWKAAMTDDYSNEVFAWLEENIGEYDHDWEIQFGHILFGLVGQTTLFKLTFGELCE